MPTESAAGADHPGASVIVAATFTADPLMDSLGLFMRETGLNLSVELAPYDQVFQELLDRTRPFSRNRNGVNVVLVRLDDWLRNGGGDLDRPEVRAKLEKLVADLVVALRQAARAIAIPIVLGVCPSPLATGSLPKIRTFLASLEDRLLEGVAGLPTVHLLSRDRLRPLEPRATYDPESDRLARLPYTPIFFAHLGTAVARLVHALKSPPRKVLVLDCDDTLWKGRVGEERVAGIAITPPYRALQSFALAKKSAGMLLCLASKNVDADVTEVFRGRPDMLLHESDIAAMRVNWLPKSENLRSLAAELNLGLDSFVFVDDSPVECAEVEASCPGVLALRLPVGGDFATFLQNVWPLDQLRVTDEDRRRTEAYRQNRERLRHQQSTTSFAEFIESLELRIDLAPARPEHHARVAQLTQRTNQFNFTTRRRTEGEEVARLAAEGLECRVVEVADRFGDYGLVGLLIFGVAGSSLVIDTMLLSCRALGRGVEHAMLRELGAVALARGITQVEAPFVPTQKNLPARLFLDGLETLSRVDQGPGTHYRLAADRAAQVVYAPGQASAAGPDASPGAGPTDGAHNDNATRAPDALRGEAPSVRWNRIARELDTPAKVLSALAAARRRGRGLKENAAPPRTELERTLCRIWAEELGLSEVGIRDDYFELGGTSLAAVSIFARLEREVGPRIPLATLMEAQTVEALAARLARGGDSGSLVVLSEEGSGIPLFLIHDADGETLLYRNLARRLLGRPVYGLQPYRGGGFSIRHTRIEEMVAHYLHEIRQVRPHGPYLLGGLCAGGVLAFELARQLELAHEEARLVAIFDAAAAQARVRPHLETRRRLDRIRAAIGRQPLTRIPRVLICKARGYLRHQIGRTVRRATDRVSVIALRRTLDRGGAAPDWLKKVSVRTVYTHAEAEYRTDHVLREEIVLFRATDGVGHEQPYIQIYQDPLLGWGPRSAKGVTAIDVPGGHGSLLQEPNVAAVADVLAPLLAAADRALAEQRTVAAG